MNHSHDLPLGKRLVDAFVMLVVAAISMVLLIYVALGEARRNYERFQIEKLIAQGQVVQTALETFVRGVWNMGYDAIREVGQWILAGAIVVVPVWLIARMLGRR